MEGTIRTEEQVIVKKRSRQNPYSLALVTICQNCKKKFERHGAEWGWNIGERLYCTYKCMREAEAKMKAKRLKGEKKK